MKIKSSIILILITALFVFVSCSSDKTKTDNNKDQSKKENKKKLAYYFHDEEQVKELKSRAAKIAKISQLALGRKLKKAISDDGLEYAVGFCNLEAMKITDSLSRVEGVTIRRLAKKYRNPLNATSDNESAIYKQFVINYLSNVKAKPLLTVTESGNPIYFQVIRTQEMCLTCHGKPGETIPTNLAKKIEELYPDDKAINFEAGQPRGMWEITFNDIKLRSN